MFAVDIILLTGKLPRHHNLRSYSINRTGDSANYCTDFVREVGLYALVGTFTDS